MEHFIILFPNYQSCNIMSASLMIKRYFQMRLLVRIRQQTLITTSLNIDRGAFFFNMVRWRNWQTHTVLRNKEVICMGVNIKKQSYKYRFESCSDYEIYVVTHVWEHGAVSKPHVENNQVNEDECNYQKWPLLIVILNQVRFPFTTQNSQVAELADVRWQKP